MENVLDNVLILAATERRFTTKHDKHNYTHAPHVTLSCVATFEHFGRNVIRRAVWFTHHLVGRDLLRQSKVDQLDVAIVIVPVQ